MIVSAVVDPAAARGWTGVLLRRIAALPGVSLRIAPGRTPPGRSGAVAALLRAEALLERRPLAGWAARDVLPEATNPASPDDGPPDLVLDLVGDGATRGIRLWRLTFDGLPGEAALLSALLAGRSPVVALSEGEHVVAAARVGTESPETLLTAFEDALARTVTLVVAALQGLRPLLPPDTPSAPAGGPGALAYGAVARHLARRTARKAGNGLRRLGLRRQHWRVGWRRLDGPDLIDLRAHPAAGWHDLPDDGTRFYADPFGIVHEGQTVLFVEDFPYRRGRAVISAVAFGPDGPLGTPVPVLEAPHHLSYPFVFARDGAVWMIPESCAAGTVDLYRATAFPGGWVKERTLLSGLVASDATLLENDGRWWLFATVRERAPEAGDLPPRGAFSDALHLWSAPDFRGRWTAHPGNPVLIDIAAARPAGRIVLRDGRLIRPVQDGRGGYGAALSLARIDRLDATGYAQTVETTLRPGPLWPGTCLHTLDGAGGFEFIDGAGPVPRFRLGR